MKIYRVLTGPDDAQFCHRVTHALSTGFDLYGSPSLTYDVERKTVIVAQAIVKDVENLGYSPDLDLSQL